jgi:hypothetical protein
MDVTVFAITSLSLILAAVMSVAAWRMSREERRRSDARVAAAFAVVLNRRTRGVMAQVQ